MSKRTKEREMMMPDQPETWAIDDQGNPVPGTGRRLAGAKRCKSEWQPSTRCVGVEGHEHEWHFCYDATGWLRRWRDHCENSMDIAASLTPPGHENYRFPYEMEPETYLAHTQWVPIEDGEVERVAPGIPPEVAMAIHEKAKRIHRRDVL